MPASAGDDSTVAYTTSGFLGDIARPMRPSAPDGRPLVIFFQLLPASAER